MKKFSVIGLNVALVASGALLTSVAGAAPASASGCASLVNSGYVVGSTRYADVKNVCSRGIYASVDLPYRSDPGCRFINPYQTITFRIGGSFASNARDAYVC